MALPPLRSLLAFEAVVRNASVSRAAVELGVSQPAVSQQLRVLERFFGRRLIEKTATGFRVAPDAELYAARLARAVDDIRAASSAFSEQSIASENQLSIALLATFAQRWLIPRLSGFQDRYPDIDVRLLTTSKPLELLREDVDLSIRCGDGRWPGHSSERLVENRLFPVASDTFLKTCPLAGIDDLRNAVLIRVATPPRDLDWPSWLSAVGAAGLVPRAWQTYSTSTQALEAATAGMGVAITHTPFVTDSLSSARLVKPFEHDVADAQGDYYLVSRRQRVVPRRVGLFSRWLLENKAPAG